jgi:hypothetical protein
MEGVPPPLPLLGHLLAFRRDRVALLAACAAAPGDVIRLMTSRRATDIAGHGVLTTEDW